MISTSLDRTMFARLELITVEQDNGKGRERPFTNLNSQQRMQAETIMMISLGTKGLMRIPLNSLVVTINYHPAVFAFKYLYLIFWNRPTILCERNNDTRTPRNWDQPRQANHNSAPGPTYIAACQALQLDPKSRNMTASGSVGKTGRLSSKANCIPISRSS